MQVDRAHLKEHSKGVCAQGWDLQIQGWDHWLQSYNNNFHSCGVCLEVKREKVPEKLLSAKLWKVRITEKIDHPVHHYVTATNLWILIFASFRWAAFCLFNMASGICLMMLSATHDPCHLGILSCLRGAHSRAPISEVLLATCFPWCSIAFGTQHSFWSPNRDL